MINFHIKRDSERDSVFLIGDKNGIKSVCGGKIIPVNRIEGCFQRYYSFVCRVGCCSCCLSRVA